HSSSDHHHLHSFPTRRSSYLRLIFFKQLIIIIYIFVKSLYKPTIFFFNLPMFFTYFFIFFRLISTLEISNMLFSLIIISPCIHYVFIVTLRYNNIFSWFLFCFHYFFS